MVDSLLRASITISFADSFSQKQFLVADSRLLNVTMDSRDIIKFRIIFIFHEEEIETNNVSLLSINSKMQ
jgi:hypothetical protein